MNGTISILLTNAAIAGLLALVLLACVGRLRSRPALLRGLCLLILLKLVTPPLLTVPVPSPFDPKPEPVVHEERFERSDSSSETIRGLAAIDPAVGNDRAVATSAVPARRSWVERVLRSSIAVLSGLPWATIASSIWLAGTLFYFVLIGTRYVRFRKLLQTARPATGQLAEDGRRMAHRLGLARVPSIVTVPGRVSPLLWTLSRNAKVVLPAGLLERLDRESRLSLIAHEMAHLRRRDHWVRLLEALATGLYWWNPAVWWVRRQLQDAEEQCCDAWVVWAMPAGAHTYASSLVTTMDFLSQSHLALPPATSGAGHFESLKRRLTMIMTGTTARSISPAGRIAVLLAALAVLPFLPSVADAPEPPPAPESLPAAIAAPPADPAPPPRPEPVVATVPGSPETRPEPATMPPPASAPEPATMPSPESAPEPETMPSPESAPEPETMPAPESAPEPETMPAPESAPEPAAMPAPGSAPEPTMMPSPATVPEPNTMPTPLTRPEPAPMPRHEPPAPPRPAASVEPPARAAMPAPRASATTLDGRPVTAVAPATRAAALPSSPLATTIAPRPRASASRPALLSTSPPVSASRPAAIGAPSSLGTTLAPAVAASSGIGMSASRKEPASAEQIRVEIELEMSDTIAQYVEDYHHEVRSIRKEIRTAVLQESIDAQAGLSRIDFNEIVERIVRNAPESLQLFAREIDVDQVVEETLRKVNVADREIDDRELGRLRRDAERELTQILDDLERDMENQLDGARRHIRQSMHPSSVAYLKVIAEIDFADLLDRLTRDIPEPVRRFVAALDVPGIVQESLRSGAI